MAAHIRNIMFRFLFILFVSAPLSLVASSFSGSINWSYAGGQFSIKPVSVSNTVAYIAVVAPFGWWDYDVEVKKIDGTSVILSGRGITTGIYGFGVDRTIRSIRVYVIHPQSTAGATGSITFLTNNIQTGELPPQEFWRPENLISDPVDALTGAFYKTTVDLKVNSPLPIEVKRSYSSKNDSNNELGYGWLTGHPSYLIPSDETDSPEIIQLADTEGSVFTFRKQGLTSVWAPTVADNPQLSNTTGGADRLLNSSLVQTINGTSVSYRWTRSNGHSRTYLVQQFPVSISGTTYTRKRPYLNSWVDEHGNTLTFGFGTNSTATDYGLIDKITASNGSSVSFVYDTGGRILTATANDGRVVTYAYTNGDLTSVQLPDGSTTAYVYDANHRITRETRPDGRVLENTYDTLGRVTQQKATVDPAQPGVLVVNATFDYSVAGQTKIKDAYNRETIYEYTNGLITAIREPEGRTTLQEWYATTDTATGAHQRSLKKLTDPRGLVTEYKYDAQGNVTETKLTGDLDGDPATTETSVTTAAYNALNRPTAVTDPRNIQTTFTYADPAYPYLPTAVTTSKGGTPLRTDQLAYTARSGTDANSQPISAKGLLTAKTIALGTADEAVTTYDYDATGFRTSETRATGTTDPAVTLTYTPTTRREVATVTDALGRSTAFTYDAMGRVLTRIVKDETAATLGVWTTTYTANGEVAKTDGPRSGPEDWIENDYDQAGRPSATRVYRTQAKADGSGVEAPAAPANLAITTHTHDFFGNLLKTVDPRGNATAFTYDGIGRLLTRSTYAGSATTGTPLRVESTTYEPGNKPATATNALGGVTTYAYTSTGQPRRVEGPDGSVRQWRYLPDGRVSRETLRNRSFWETTYDDVARTVTRTLKKPDTTVLATETRAFDRRGNVVSTTDAEGYVRTTAYDDLDRPKTVTGPAGSAGSSTSTLNYFYDAAGRTLRTVNALGEATVTTTDALGRPVLNQIKDGNDTVIRQTSYAYSADHQAVTVTTGSGAAALTRTTYTGLAGRLLLEIDGLGKTTRQTYDLSGNRLTTTDPLARTTTWSYNALNQPLTQTLPDGHATTFTHDAAGNLTARAMAGGPTAESTYDTAGRLTGSRLVNGADVSREFAHTYYPSTSPWAGLLQTTTTPRATVTTTYDDYLRPATVTTDGPAAATDSSTIYAYDKRGLLTSAAQSSPANAAGPATTVARAYDGYGQVLSESVTLGGATHSTVTQRWDAANRRTSLHEASAVRNNPLFEYRHRADGLLTSVRTDSYQIGTLGFDYADNGLLTRRTNSLRTQAINTRDAIGRIRQQTTTVNNVAAMVETMAYRDDGTLASYGVTRNTPNLTGAWDETRSYAYNSRGQVTSEGFSPAPAASDALAYVFDSATAGLGVRTDARVGTGAPGKWQSSATTVNTLARVTTDQTNALGRDIPTSGVSLGANYVELFVNGGSRGRTNHPGWADSPGAWSKTLSLDAGQHTLRADAVHPSGKFTASAYSSFTVNVPNVTLTSTYDADGNVTNRTWSNGTTQLLTWDAFNRLIKVAQRDASNNGYDWTAVYDAFGRRLKTTQQPVVANVASGAATLIASTFDPLVEFLEIGVAVNGVKAWKIYGPDLNGIYGGLNGTGGLEATILDADGTVKAVVNDAFGHGVATVAHTAVTWVSTRVGGYGPLPNIRAEVLTDVTRLAEATAWRGRRIDPTGFYNLGARHYEPHTARFLSADPLGHGSDMSLYAFANGDAVNGFDADGRLATKIKQLYNEKNQREFEQQYEEAKDAVRRAQRAVDDYGFEGAILREIPLLNTLPNIYDFYNGETTSGRVYEPMEWAFKGVDVGLTAATIYISVRVPLVAPATAAENAAVRASSGAESVNASAALRSKLSALEDAQQTAARTRTLPDGRIRYYEAETLASKPGPTRGAAYTTEWDPATGRVRSWMESYNHAGEVTRVHPKMLNGETLNSPHFPPTARELANP
jgi:RHS repeat-associated protein